MKCSVKCFCLKKLSTTLKSLLILIRQVLCILGCSEKKITILYCVCRPFEVQWLLYVPPTLTLKFLYFAQRLYLFYMIIRLNCIYFPEQDWLVRFCNGDDVFSVYWEFSFLSVIFMNFRFPSVDLLFVLQCWRPLWQLCLSWVHTGLACQPVWICG